MKYYLKFRDNISGPYSLDMIHRLKADGMLSAEHCVSTDQANWMPVEQLPEESSSNPIRAPLPSLDDLRVKLQPYIQTPRRLLIGAGGIVMLLFLAIWALFSTPDSLERKAEKGDAAAQCQLGKHYLVGDHGFRKDERMAAQWFEKAAAQGHAEAQEKLGNMCRMGTGGLRRDLFRAAKLFETAAPRGDAEAQMWLGMFHMGGLGGITKNERKGREWLEKSADQQFGDAQVALALMYLEGSGGVRKDTVKARQLVEQAAENGSEAARNLLRK